MGLIMSYSTMAMTVPLISIIPESRRATPGSRTLCPPSTLLYSNFC